MRGAILGDIVGSPYEGPLRGPPIDFPLFIESSRYTDDTVCSAAVADAILNGRSFAESLRDWGRRYPHAGYGQHYASWLRGEIADGYGSWGNGAPMRVSPCAWLAASEEQAMALAERASVPTHNHPDAVAAAQAVVVAIWAGRRGEARGGLAGIARRLLGATPPPLPAMLAGEDSDIKAKSTVLRAFTAVIAAEDVETALRYAVHSGADTDTTAAIAGSVAEAFLPLPDWMWAEAHRRLPADIAAISDALDTHRGLG